MLVVFTRVVLNVPLAGSHPSPRVAGNWKARARGFEKLGRGQLSPLLFEAPAAIPEHVIQNLSWPAWAEMRPYNAQSGRRGHSWWRQIAPTHVVKCLMDAPPRMNDVYVRMTL